MMKDIKLNRSFVDAGLKISRWEDLAPYFERLEDADILSKEQLRQWFQWRSELGAIVSEDLAWRYIRMTCDTANQDHAGSYREFVEKIQPRISPVNDRLNRKVLASPFLAELEEERGFYIMIREMRKDVEIFREKNIPLFTKLQNLSQEFSQVSGGMSIEHDGRELTLQQAAVFLQSTNRELRRQVYDKIAARRAEDRTSLDEIFDKMVALRTEVAKNAGFENFRDYMFRSMGRFDYAPGDCFDFHESVRTEMVPMLNEQAEDRRKALGIEDLRPYDKAVDKEGKVALKPFEGGEDLLNKTIECFSMLDPFLGDCLRAMEEMGHLDLESRKGKAPGGYNYPLYESGAPFIFMNATSTVRDMVTLLHEGGHAVHSFLVSGLELTDFKSTPSEVAELASMSMELLSMDHWDVFFNDENELRRAKKEHLEQIIETLPWVATIDKFQHWIYENPAHTREERTEEWNRIFGEFSDGITEWKGLENNRDFLWQKQLHLFEVPFYYIEYGMAQLGAIAVWKRFREDREAGLKGYMNALKLGYTRSIPELYEAAGIRFDFSKEYIRELADFVKMELKSLDH